MKSPSLLTTLVLTASGAWPADHQVAVRFQAMVDSEKLACDKTYTGIGTTKSTLLPRDFRFYVHNVALIDDSGRSVPVEFTQDGKWQLDDVAPLDFEDATGGIVNGTPDTNDRVVAMVPAGHYIGPRFTLGVPFNTAHTDLTIMPPPFESRGAELGVEIGA